MPATADIIGQMMAACPDITIGLRAAALLGIGFAAALRRAELVAIEVADVTFVDDGLRLLIPRSKTDRTGEGAEVAVIRGVRIRPAGMADALWQSPAGPYQAGEIIADLAAKLGDERQRSRSRAETTLPARRNRFNQLQARTVCVRS